MADTVRVGGLQQRKHMEPNFMTRDTSLNIDFKKQNLIFCPRKGSNRMRRQGPALLKGTWTLPTAQFTLREKVLKVMISCALSKYQRKEIKVRLLSTGFISYHKHAPVVNIVVGNRRSSRFAHVQWIFVKTKIVIIRRRLAPRKKEKARIFVRGFFRTC